MLRKYCLLILLLFSTFRVSAQTTYSITGSVLDKETNEVIPGAQIFLNGTTIGTTSNEDGLYVLDKIPDGIFDLNVSLLGFEGNSITINTSSLAPPYDFVLKAKIYELDEVMVRPDPENWKNDFEQFRKYFIGIGPFSKNTKIKNPEVLSFDFDPDMKTLSARVFDNLIIENKDLGYQITYYLDYFEINYSTGTTLYYGRPFFQTLSSKRNKTIAKWSKNREAAYRGSFLHFTRSLVENIVEENGYVFRGEKRENKSRYISKDTINDDLFFFQIDSNTYMFNFMNFVNVANTSEKEEKSFLEFIWSPTSNNVRTTIQDQISSFTLSMDSVLVDKSGYIYDPLSILFDGYWSFEQVSDLMPLDYYIMQQTK